MPSSIHKYLAFPSQSSSASDFIFDGFSFYLLRFIICEWVGVERKGAFSESVPFLNVRKGFNSILERGAGLKVVGLGM